MRHESGKSPLMVIFKTTEKIAWIELAWGVKRVWKKDKAQEVGRWYLMKKGLCSCASQTQVEGLEVKKRKCVLPWEWGQQLAPGRTAQTGLLKGRKGRKIYFDDFRSYWMLKQIDSKLIRHCTVWWSLDLPLPPPYSVVSINRDILSSLVLLW